MVKGKDTMYEGIRGLKFSSPVFSGETRLTFFPSDKARMALIYGKNGSGKSTISKAISKANGTDIPEIPSAVFIDVNGDEISIPENDESRIFVFNEDYIQNKVRLKKDGLSTIVMFGEQGDLEDKIERAEMEAKAAELQRKLQADVCESYRDPSSTQFPAYFMSRIKENLQGDSHWAGRERQISSAKRNASVRDDTIQTIIQHVPEESEQEVRASFYTQLEVLHLAKTDKAKIETPVNTSISITQDEGAILTLLATVIERPI